MSIITSALALVAAAAILASSASAAKTVEATLNGLQLSIDADTGSILRMVYPGPGTLLESSPDKASILDAAYPIKQFEPLRLSSRFSKNVRIEKTDDEVTISWERLGASRTFDLPGKVSAVVHLKAAPDHRSIIMSCDIDNQSQTSIRQVIFPDFTGLLPTNGLDGTIFKTGSFGTAPFQDLAISEGRASDQFATDFGSYSVEYAPGGMFHSMTMRWCDFGGLTGGFSLFPKRWGWDAQVPVRLTRSQTEEKIRMLSVHLLEIKAGEKWNSGEFVFTPHLSGWAKGIEPFREWVRSHIKREYPVPKHVREGLGFRTVWMTECQPEDPKGDAVWKMSDLPALAEESKAHGIDEMVLWAWCNGFELPLPGPFSTVGSEKDMIEAIATCRKLGVNVAPFISVLQAGRKTGAKYGLTVPEAGGWTQHTELIPALGASYAGTLACAAVDTSNALWQKEALDSCKRLVDIGIPSLSWDQFWSEPKEPSILTLTKEIRAYSKKQDPESTFSGEELWNVEIDSEYLDYTWNWGGWRDWQAYTSVFPAPRRNCCITWSATSVKQAFMDNLYINIFPRKPDSVNGSDYIANYPELSKALKQCAKLRKQFLPYFTDGALIGNCILAQPSPAAIGAYVLPDKVLMLVANRGGEGPVSFNTDIGQWLASKSGKYSVKAYDEDGKLTKTISIPNGKWAGETAKLKTWEIALFEFEAE